MLAAKLMAFEISMYVVKGTSMWWCLHQHCWTLCSANTGYKEYGWAFEIGMCVVGGTNMWCVVCINVVEPWSANTGWAFEIGMCVVGGTNMPPAEGLLTCNQCRRLLQSPAVQSLSSNHLFLAVVSRNIRRQPIHWVSASKWPLWHTSVTISNSGWFLFSKYPDTKAYDIRDNLPSKQQYWIRFHCIRLWWYFYIVHCIFSICCTVLFSSVLLNCMCFHL